MSERLGTLFVDEQPLPITRIYLAGGEIQIEAEIHGAINLPLKTEARLHDPTGRLVAIVPWRAPKKYRKMLQSSNTQQITTISFGLLVTGSDWP